VPNELPQNPRENFINGPRPLPGRKPRALPGSAPRQPSAAKPDAASGPSAHPVQSIPSGSSRKPVIRRPTLLAGLAAAAAAGILAGVMVARRDHPAAPPAIAAQTGPGNTVAPAGPVGLAGTAGSLTSAAPPAIPPPTPQHAGSQPQLPGAAMSPAARPAMKPPPPPKAVGGTPAPEGSAGTVSSRRSARSAPRAGAAPWDGAAAALPSPDGRDAAAAKVRAKVDAGIEQIEAELQNLQTPPDAQLAALRDRVRRLESITARDPAQASSLRLLERRIEAGLAESRAAARALEVDRAAWQRQISEIEGLIGERSYPEAKRLAKKLAADAAAPPDVAARARELAAQADSALKSIFGGTRFGHEHQQIQKAPPPS
jgi:hypothetical protein